MLIYCFILVNLWATVLMVLLFVRDEVSSVNSAIHWIKVTSNGDAPRNFDEVVAILDTTDRDMTRWREILDATVEGTHVHAAATVDDVRLRDHLRPLSRATDDQARGGH